MEHQGPEQPGNPPRLTVAIPLYRGAQWEQVVVQNIRRIPADARIILSDEVSSDDAACRIAAQFPGDRRIQVRMRNGLTGWREHFNALIRENDTELFCLLPQDDTIEPGFYEKLVAALDASPGAGLAFGRLVANAKLSRRQTFSSPPFVLGTSTPWLEALLLERYWNLAIALRAVIRRESLRPITATRGDQYADLLWVFGMALSTYMLEVPDAIYLKRYYGQNTHGNWQLPSEQERKAMLTDEIRNVFGDKKKTEQVIGSLEQIYACPKTTCERFYTFIKRFVPESVLRRR